MTTGPSAPKRGILNLRGTISELFDIGPGVALSVLAVIAVFIVGGIVYLIQSAPPRRLTMASGPEGSQFHRTANRYAKQLEKSGVKLEVQITNGSIENLKRVSEGKVDLALIQDGVMVDGKEPLDHLVSLGGIGNQPVFVFYNGLNLENLSQLKGKRIAIGSEGSGTRTIALKLLDLNGIKIAEPGETKFLNLDADDVGRALEDKTIDAAFVMGENIGGRELRQLMRSSAVKLLSFHNAAAYARKLDYLNVLDVPQGLIDFGKNIPNKDTLLVGPMIELVAQESIHPAISDLVLEAATTIHARPGMFQKRGEFPAPVEQTIKLSEDAARYYKSGKTFLYRYLPFWLANLITRFLLIAVPMVVVLVPLVKSIPTLFKWRSEMRIRRLYRILLEIETDYRAETDSERRAQLRKRFDTIGDIVGRMHVRPIVANQFYALRLHIDYAKRLMEDDAQAEAPLRPSAS